MATVETSVFIERPVEQVFAYTSDPARVAEWAGPVVESKQTSPGAVGVGTTSTRVTQMLGRTMEATYEITEYEPNKAFADVTTSGPVQINSRLLFDAVDGGTKVTIIGDLEPGGFFKLAEPLILRTARRQVAADAQTLKDLLESS